MFYDYVLPTPDGPMPTVGWEGAREGTLDYRLIRAVEQSANDDATPPDTRYRMARWLEKIRSAVKPELYSGAPAYHWDCQDTYDPGLNLDEIRREAVEFLQG